ncbi:autotransporter domain-containing protein, partial [Ahrensia marina]
TIEDGGAVSNGDGVIGNDSDGVGAVTVTGSGSTWDNTSTLRVGNAGTGTLTIADGGAVSVNSGTGTVMIADDAGSAGALNIGDGASAGILNAATVDGGSGAATLNFKHTDTDYFFTNDGTSAGAAIDITGTVAVNHTATGTTTLTGTNTYTGSTIVNFGTLAVDGGSIAHTSADLIVGGFSSDDGTLTIKNGGSVSNNEAGIGYAAGSEGEVSVTGAGSNWTNSGTLYVGLAGSGTVTIADGGSVSNTAGTVGSASGAIGTVTVTGAGSSWSSSSDLYVGESGTGTMNVEDGATAFVGDDVVLGFNATGNGTLTVDSVGSELDITNAFVVGRAGIGALKVQNGGTLTGNYSYVGNSSGATGTATITGSGSSWSLTGDLYIAEQGTGTMTIADGGTVSNAVSYIGYDSGSDGAVTVTGAGSTWTNNSTLYVGEDGNGTLTISDGGTVSAVGGVEIASASGSSVINIGAAEGNAAVAAGTLDTSAIVFGSGNGELVFNHTDTAYDFDAAIFGLGSIEHFAGVTNLTADNSGFTGETVVSGGSLYVNDSIGGTVYVDDGTLGGSGTTGALTVNFGGNLAPGNSIGTLNVASAIFNAGSTYTVELNNGGFVAGTNNDLLNATGVVTINGGTVNVTSENGTEDGSTYATPGTYTIITGGSVTGTFDNVSDDYVFLDFTDSYDATNVYLTSEQVVFFSDIAETPNQQAIASPLEALGSGNTVYDALVGLVGDEDDARAAFDSLTGEIYASAQTALLEDSRLPREAAMERIRHAFDGIGTDNSAQTEDRISESFGLWSQGFGAWSQWKSDGNAATMDRSIGGLLVGGDTMASDNVRFGMLGGYSRSHLNLDNRLSSGTAETYTLGVYGGGEWDAFSLKGGIAHSWHNLDTSRSVAFNGFSDILSASYNARTLQAWGELAVSFDTDIARFEPFANLTHVNLNIDGFTETGGAAALTAAPNNTDATFLTVGLRAETEVSLGSADVTLRGTVAWQHAFSNVPTSQMSFASGDSPFTIDGVPLAQDSLALGAGFDVNLTDSAKLDFSYDGRFGSDVHDHSATVSLNVLF